LASGGLTVGTSQMPVSVKTYEDSHSLYVSIIHRSKVTGIGTNYACKPEFIIHS